MEPEEHSIRVPRTGRYAVLGDPASASEVWLVLHGYRQLARRFIRRFGGLPGVSEGRRAVVAPEGLSRFYIEREVGPHGPESRVGATWMTREDRENEIEDYVEYLDRVAEKVLGTDARPAVPSGSHDPERGARRVVVLGFSQGCETASRWITMGRMRPRELILWGGGLAEDLPSGPAASALARARLRLVVGEQDRWALRRSEETLDRVREWGLETPAGTVIRYPGGHQIDEALLTRAWPWSGSD